MKELLYYKPRIVTDISKDEYPDIARFSHFFQIFNHDVTILDRTGVLRIPINVKSLFPVPAYRIFTKTYEEVCNERAQELLNHAQERGLPIYVMYSGGIDSTTVLISLLKHATKEQREHITVLLSENSIAENPEFYQNHIEGKLTTTSSVRFMYLLGTDAIVVSGEHNDQIFGSDVIGKFMRFHGSEIIHKPYNRDLFISFFNGIENKEDMNVFYIDLFEQLVRKAPVSIDTNYLFLWWINFALKWQSVFLRPLVFTSARNINRITETYVRTQFFSFYNTEAFQLWSLNNLDKRMKDDWKSYKWVAKDLIYEYTKDALYRDNKTKVGSLYHLMVGNSSYRFVDSTFNFYDTLPLSEYYNADNSFGF